MSRADLPEILKAEIAMCGERITRIRGILDTIKPEADRAQWDRLVKRRTQWEVYQTALLQSATYRPSLNMVWGGSLEV